MSNWEVTQEVPLPRRSQAGVICHTGETMTLLQDTIINIHVTPYHSPSGISHPNNLPL
jgi:hypothetical protein